MKEATFIKAGDLANLTTDENGNYLIPDGIKIFIEEDASTVLQNKIDILETELSNMIEPTDQELIDDGKINHPYYILLEEITLLKNK